MWLVGQAASNGVIAGLATAVLTAPIVGAGGTLAIALVGAALGAAVAVPDIRRRRLVVDDTGITAVRNGYELHTRWDELQALGQGRFAVVVPITLLRLDDATIVGTGGRALNQRRLAKIHKAGADRIIQLSIYVEDPEVGPFGDILRTHRPDLVAER